MTTYIQLNSADPSVLDHSTPGDFTVQLGRAHVFAEDSEVFLSESVVPFTWHNVTQENNSLVIKGEVSKTVVLPPAYYESIPALVKAINDALKAASLSTITFTVDKQTMKVSADAGKSTIQGALLRLLGWPKGAIVSGTVTAPKMGDITGGCNSLYVLVDCVALTTAGSFSIPLLKKLEVGRDDRPGDLMHFRSFDPVEAHRLSQNTLMHIGVTIKNRRNQIVDFNEFPVDLTLEIRAIRRD